MPGFFKRLFSRPTYKVYHGRFERFSEIKTVFVDKNSSKIYVIDFSYNHIFTDGYDKKGRPISLTGKRFEELVYDKRISVTIYFDIKIKDLFNSYDFCFNIY